MLVVILLLLLPIAVTRCRRKINLRLATTLPLLQLLLRIDYYAYAVGPRYLPCSGLQQIALFWSPLRCFPSYRNCVLMPQLLLGCIYVVHCHNRLHLLLSPAMPLFTRYYQPGRLCVIHYGPDTGKLCFVVDIINQSRVLVDGAGVTGVRRQSMPMQRIALTDHYVKVPRGVRSLTLKKAVEAGDILSKFNASSWGKKRQIREQRKNMTDFDRFKLMVIMKQRRRIMQQKLKSMK
ncbi:UNVERIFIED_CONTAM: hypothetical protein H355_009669 [Colinus virginianus]|nr:hypothetical protein H355_009669 [Colinus virginianus]